MMIKEKKGMDFFLLQASKKKFEGDLLTYNANLNVLLSNPAGIGEHSDIVGEVCKLIQHAHDAKGCLEIVDAYIEEHNY